MKEKITPYLILKIILGFLILITDLVVGVRLLSKCKLYFYQTKNYHKKKLAISNFCVYIVIFECMIMISHEGTFKFENEGSLFKSYPCKIQPSWDIKEINQYICIRWRSMLVP